MAVVARVADVLSYYLTYRDLTGPSTLVHIHGFSPPGVPSGVQHNIGTANPVVGQWAYPAVDEASILGGLTYFNVHTMANGGGEVRGQIEFAPLPCPTDIDCSGDTDFGDILAILSAWGACVGCVEDTDGDGIVGFSDLLNVLSAWGPCPG